MASASSFQQQSPAKHMHGMQGQRFNPHEASWRIPCTAMPRLSITASDLSLPCQALNVCMQAILQRETCQLLAWQLGFAIAAGARRLREPYGGPLRPLPNPSGNPASRSSSYHKHVMFNLIAVHVLHLFLAGIAGHEAVLMGKRGEGGLNHKCTYCMQCTLMLIWPGFPWKWGWWGRGQDSSKGS